ncbi:MAG: CDGSH iron-sulfur domain-containing protein [Magnetococcales bacterium]|nr:CDGSH iron-sulfur domain-containing protein [Magnetococcales bacterium]
MWGLHPVLVELPAGRHKLCLCGDSDSFPACDDSRRGVCSRAVTVDLPEDGRLLLCACGKSSRGHLCDGSHGYSRKVPHGR